MAQNLELALRVRSQMQEALRDLDRLQGELRDVDRHAGRASGGLSKVGGALLTSFGPLLAGAGAVAGIRAIIQNTIEAEQALAQLDARLRSTGGAAGLSRDQLVEMASALQDSTTFGDEAVQSAEALLLTFTRIGGDVFPRALTAVADMSVAMGQDLQSSAIQVGKALNEPIRGVAALQRVGVQFTEQQREQIRVLVESGRAAEAQGVILSELETQFGGAARAARDTLGGALTALGNAFGDLLEGDASGGGIVDTKSAIEDLIRLLQDPGTQAAFQGIIGLLAGIGSGVVGLAAEVGDVGIAISEQVRIITGDMSELERIDSTLREIEQRRRGPLVGGVGLLFKSSSELDAMEEELKTQREIVVARQQAEAVGPPLPPPPIVNAEYEKLLASLREQANTMGLVGEVAKVRYAIEQGALGELDAAQQANLLRYAEQIDAQERAAKSRDDAGTRAEEAAQRALASMEEEIALQGQIRSGSAQISEEARIRYEIESGAYRQASAATQQQLLEQARLIDAIRATAGVRRELESITERASGATDRYRDIQDALRIALDEGLISQQRYNAELAVATREYQAAVDPIREMNREIDEQVRLLQLSSREREIEAQMVRARDRLAAQGTSFDAQPGSADAMRNRLEQLQALNEASDRQETMVRIADSLPGADPQMDYAIIVAGELNRLWQETAGTLLGLNARLLAVDKAWAAGAITLDHYRRLLAEVNIEAATVLNEMSAGNSLTILVQALGHVVEGFKSVQSSLADILGSGLAEWADGLSNGIARAVIQGDSLRDTLYDIATNVATEMLAQFIKMGIQMAVIRMLAGSNLTGSINGLVMGAAQNALQFNPSDIFRGMFGGLAGGGQVLGPGTTTSDSILAALSHKEFVTRAAVVMQPGALNFLEDFNARGMAALRDWSAVHHATGGLAGVPAPAFPAPSAEVSLAEPAGARVDNNFRFVNVFDVEDVSRRVVATGTFEKQVLNIVGSNPSAIRQRLGL